MARPRGSRKQQERLALLARGNGKALGYVRVSTEQQAEGGHSLDGQKDRLRVAADREGLELLDIIVEVESSMKKRPGLEALQERIRAGEAGCIVYPKLDRLGRSLIDTAKLVEWACTECVDLLSTDEGWQVRDGVKVDKMLPFRLAMAEVELQRIRERTREGLAAAKSKGVQLGTGKRTKAEDPAAVRAIALLRKGLTYAAIAAALNAEGFTTARGCAWAMGNTHAMLRRIAPDLVDARAEGNAVLGGGLEVVAA
jgi:site-specific DNA recombinase